MPIYSITEAKDNSDLMILARELGYLAEGVVIHDLTYGQGRFWTKWRPSGLVTSDLSLACDTQHHWDFRDLPWLDNISPTPIVFDPPYGYRGTSRLASDAAYGLGEYLSTEERELLMAQGMKECARVMSKGAVLLFKMQDQSVSGAKRWQTKMFWELGRELGLDLIDELHLRSLRAQPDGKTQCHSWVNFSTLQVYTKVRP